VCLEASRQPGAVALAAPIHRRKEIQITSMETIFTVNGRPFFPLGGQARNSSGYNAAEAETALQAVQLLHGNTLEIPLYWEQIEPQEGQFCFDSLEALLEGARRHGLRLILLWFGSWKNGAMDYVPAWVKAAPQRFRRVQAPAGGELWVLSSHCAANFEADRRAYTALCAYLKEADGDQRTVIALQIENEPGILGSDRDYGPQAQAEFAGPVPAALLERLQAGGAGPVFDLWREAGERASGSWPELFGVAAGELFSAWSIATYINRLAQAGKAVYSLPVYINAWLAEQGWQIPGETYPCGGPVSKVLDIYKWFTPEVDLIAPDIYLADTQGYRAVCAAYARPDNPLFVPESAPGGSNAWLLFRALGEFGAIGYCFFAVEQVLAADGSVRPESQLLMDSFRSAAAALPLLIKYRGTGRVHAVVQEEHQASQRLELHGWHGLVEFEAGKGYYKDWRHLPDLSPQASPQRGRGLVIQAEKDLFYLVGSGYRLLLRPPHPPAALLSLAQDKPHYLSVAEGHCDAEGAFVVDRQRNGDEIYGGVWVEADCGVVRVALCG
jgi:beta-galactosidase GanA